MEKNVASQKVACFAWDNANSVAKTGDAGNISAQISIDGAATAATNDVNPTELDAADAPGVYLFDMTQAETNGDLVIISPVSSTADIDIRPIFIYTTVTDAIKTETALIVGDTVDIQSRIPAALSSGNIKADTLAVSTSTTAADNLKESALGIVPFACEGTPTTTVIQTDLAEATDDHYIGRVIVLTDGDGAFEASDITDYAGATGTITVTALTTAPSSGDKGVVI